VRTIEDRCEELAENHAVESIDDLKQDMIALIAEARKSMRCCSCRYFIPMVKDGFNRSLCESPNTILTSIKEDPNKWGCSEHQERKGDA
jgi:hypothetical protein